MKSLGIIPRALVLASFAAFAQSGARMHMRMYDPSTETTIQGVVDAVNQGARGAMMGTHLAVKTGDEITSVMLGPADFIKAGGFVFAKGDEVEITGSRATMGATSVVIAREIVKDGKTLTLRDKDGNPKWARGMMRPGAGAKQQ